MSAFTLLVERLKLVVIVGGGATQPFLLTLLLVRPLAGGVVGVWCLFIPSLTAAYHESMPHFILKSSQYEECGLCLPFKS